MRHLSVEHGLGNRHVEKIIQDHQGILWIGSRDGLFRFDGYQFEAYNTNNNPEHNLPSSNVFALAEDSEHRLWIGFENGLFVLNPKRNALVRLSTLGIPDLFGKDYKCSFVFNAKGEMFLLVGQSLYRYTSGSLRLWHTFASNTFVAPSEGLYLSEKDSALYLFDALRRLHRFKNGQLQKIEQLVYIEKRQTVPIYQHVQNLLTNFGDSATLCLNPGNLLPKFDPQRNCYAVAVGDNLASRLPAWAAVLKWIADNPSAFPQNVAQDIWANEIVHKKENIWYFATNYGIFLVEHSALPFQHLSVTKGKSVRGITQLEDGRLLVGTYNGLITCRPNETVGRLDTNLWAIRGFVPWHRDSMIVCLEGYTSLYVVLNNGHGHFYKKPMANTENFRFVNCIAPIRRGVWVAARYNHLGYIHRSTLQVKEYGQPPDYGITKALLYDPPSTLWAAGERGVQQYLLNASADSIVETRSNALPQPLKTTSVNALYRTRDGSLWVGTNGKGIYRYIPKSNGLQHWDVSDGLAHSIVYSILASHNDSILWLGTQNGLSRFDVPNNVFYNFYAEDGLGQNEFNTSARYIGRDGFFYFGGINGVMRFKPEFLQNSIVARNTWANLAFLDDLTFRWRTDVPDDHATVEVTPSEQYWELRFTTDDLANAPNVQFRYRLHDIQNDWKHVKIQEKVIFSKLAPGQYVLEAQTMSAHGIWGPAYRITLILLPAWHQTWWFKGLLFSFLLGLAYMAYRARINAIHRDYALRKSVSDDLHDDIGSRLYGLKVMASQLSDAEAPPRERALLSKQFEAASKDVLQAIRDFIWAFDPQHDPLPKFVQRLEDFLDNIVRPLVPNTHFNAPDRLPQKALHSTTRHHVLMVFQELLTNIVKHTETHRIDIHVKYTPSHLYISINNHHRGLKTTPPNPAGKGLASLESRLANNKISFEKNETDAYQTFTISIPL